MWKGKLHDFTKRKLSVERKCAWACGQQLHQIAFPTAISSRQNKKKNEKSMAIDVHEIELENVD
jgi:hypothetical protein